MYRHAVSCGVSGFVRNDPRGVTLDIEGEEGAVAAFFAGLAQNAPYQSQIIKITRRRFPPRGYESFRVEQSETVGRVAVHLPPDLATCPQCLKEMHDPEDRRYRYPFTNCVDCGPRFTIVHSLPYDRANTTMAGFTLCPACAEEYENPGDRRFHAQPDACPICGPRLSLLEPRGSSGGRVEDDPGLFGPGRQGLPSAAREVAEGEAALRRAQELLAGGGIVAVKGLGGYHLACDAFSDEAVDRLRLRKDRKGKALAVMFRDLATLRARLPVTEDEESELLSSAHPIVVVEGRLSPSISPDTETTGVFLPYAPIHHLLLEPFEALVLTSGNRRDEPLAHSEEEAASLLGEVADAILAHDRPIAHRCDDSVIHVVQGGRRFFRRARGFVPAPVRIAPTSAAVLAVGGEMKSTFCLLQDGEAYLSQHIGELRDYSAYSFFRSEIDRWEEMLRVRPRVIAHDLHPGYLSTRYALEREDSSEDVLLVGVQHHHAHIAGVMAEYGLQGPVLGVALDGTGYGPDGTVWGGEFILADRAEFERLAHFKTYPMPGGERAVEEPWRMAYSIAVIEGLPWPPPAADIPASGPSEEELAMALRSGINCPLTSSAGRLFDGVAALLGLCSQAGYEAQGAIRLEAASDARVKDRYPFGVREEGTPWLLDFGPALQELVEEAGRGTDAGVVAARFHNTVVAAVAEVCLKLGEKHGLGDVALSGGVFQNRLLLTGVAEALERGGMSVHLNSLVPPNDGGLSLGQAAVAAARSSLGDDSCA